MATVIGKKRLCSTNLRFFKALQGIAGKTLFDRYKVAESSIINSYIEGQYQYFLAYPVQDGDTITFYGKNYKETPQIITDLNNENFKKYNQIKEETLAHYNSKIVFLKNAGKLHEAEYLEDAVKYIDDRFVYCYDGLVVLGVWGMQLRNDVRDDISVIRKNLIEKTGKVEPGPVTNPPSPVVIRFYSGTNGKLNGISEITKLPTEVLSDYDIPSVEPYDGYEFIGWNENPDGYEVNSNKDFIAQYRQIYTAPSQNPENKIPWYRRFWDWLRAMLLGRGCLKWLLALLLLLLLLFLLSRIFKGCNNIPPGSNASAIGDNDSSWIKEDPRVGNGGGIYDPGNPYTPVPAPPDYEGILPPLQGVLPPLEENPEIIPGNPSVIANRLNVLMESENKSIMDLAKAFKLKYPDDKYKIVYFDNVVKRMQVEVPKEEREQLKVDIPKQFAPDYELFVFDEALFEGTYSPSDPVFADPDKSYYLKAINAPDAWDVTRGSEKITVAVIDNGFSLNHPELNRKVVQPYNVWKHSKDIFSQKIDHGTHVAGIALAIADNGTGLCGIAPNCKFMPIQVADSKNMMTTTSVLDGILYALYQGADVINVSLGSQFIGLSQVPESTQMDLIQNHFKEEERLWREVMRIAAKHNSTVVIAAGNDNVLAGIDALQRPDLFITVSAVDKNNQYFGKATFSNYGRYSTISAPGVDIFSTVGSNGYQSMDGTSMAAPMVSGTVALMKSVNPQLTTKQIKCILQVTGIEAQGNIGRLIQIDKALQKVRSGTWSDCTPAPSTGDVQVLLSWNNYNDLDLICTDPSGESVYFKNPSVSSGGQLQIDMNVEYPDSKTPIENIFWKPGGAPNGTYNVYLMYYHKHESKIDATPYNIKVKYGGKTENYSGIIKGDDKVIHIAAITLGSSSNDEPLRENLPSDEKRNQLEQKKKRLQEELDRVNNEIRRLSYSN